MPLSKAKDKARKKKERAQIRLDKQLLPPQTSKPVQPKQTASYRPDLDADGKPIYE